MKITEIKTLLVAPRWLFVKVLTDEGIYGVGEALGDKAETIATAIKELSRYLVGKDPRLIEHHWQVMYQGAFWRGGPILTAAISGVEQALWDISGKSLNVPVYQLLGGRCRDKIRIYANIGYIFEVTPPAKDDTIKKIVEKVINKGFTAIKFSPFRQLKLVDSYEKVKEAVDKVKKIRQIVGDKVDIMLDFHGRVSPAMAVVACEELAPYHPFFIEEPCLPENVDCMARIVQKTNIPIATGERRFTRFGFREILEKGAASILQPDLAICGGIMEGKKIAAMAEVYYVAIAPHCPYGPILTAASLQLDACIHNFLIQEHCPLGDNVLEEPFVIGKGILKEPFVLKEGYIEVPTKPGLGIELDEEAIAKRPYEPYDFPLWYHEDGSFAVW